MSEDLASAHAVHHRPLLPLSRYLLVTFSALTVLAVVSLFLGSGSTDRYFAWTIKPPLTAAFLGAGYGAGTVLVVLALGAREWALARVALLTIFVFTVCTLGATVLHRDRFHFSSGGALARFAAWFWLAVYIVVPLWMLVLFVAQLRLRGADRARRQPMPSLLRIVLAVQGAVLLVAGVALYLAPGSANSWWPWKLTPLTARAVASWLLAFAVAAALSLWESDLGRLEVAATAYTAFGLLEFLALARYTDSVDWARPTAWIYTGMLVLVTLTGAYGWRRARQGRPT